MGGRIVRGLVAALLLSVAGAAVAGECVPQHCYTGSITCATAALPCYLPGPSGTDMGDCGKTSVTLLISGGTVSLDVQAKNDLAETFQTVDAGTLTTDGVYDQPTATRYSRLKITACGVDGACTGTVSVCGYR